jgi:hypothetical protein
MSEENSTRKQRKMDGCYKKVKKELKQIRTHDFLDLVKQKFNKVETDTMISAAEHLLDALLSEHLTRTEAANLLNVSSCQVSRLLHPFNSWLHLSYLTWDRLFNWHNQNVKLLDYVAPKVKINYKLSQIPKARKKREIIKNSEIKDKKRPPLGLIPRFVFESQRVNMIIEAIYRYIEAESPIPIEWIEEYNELIKKP